MATAPAPRPAFRHALGIQLRVIDALLRREILTRYGRHNIGFLWLFVEPMIFTIGVTTLWTATKSVHGSDLPIVAFALTGYSSVLLWRNMPGRCIGALQNNLALMYHRNIKVMDIYIARLLIEFGGATISFVVLTLLFLAIDWIAPPDDILKVFAGWLLIAWFGSRSPTCCSRFQGLRFLSPLCRNSRRNWCCGSRLSTASNSCAKGSSVRARRRSMIWAI